MLFPQQVKNSSDYDRILSFFQDLLRPERSCRLEEEYPLVFHRDRASQLFVKQINGELLAGLATLEREIEMAQGQMAKALFIGSVVTHPLARMKGYQRELFHAVEEYAESSGIDLLCLWSSQIQFYEKLGFRLGGLQATWVSAHNRPLAESQSFNVRVGSTRELPLKRKFYDEFARKTFRVSRTFEEMQLLWNIPRMTVACTESAYALMGKGEDFHHVCHEWAGPAEEVLACLEALRREDAQLKILTPGVVHLEDEFQVVRRLEQNDFDPRLEYLGLFLTLNPNLRLTGLDPQKLNYPFFIWGLDSI